MLTSLHSSLIPHWQPFVFNQRKMLKQCSIEQSIRDTVYLCPCHRGLWGAIKGKMTLSIPYSMTLPRIGLWKITMTGLWQTLMPSLLSFHLRTAFFWTASRLLTRFSVTHGWKRKGQRPNKFLNSFRWDWIWYFLPCCFGITEGSPQVFADGHLSINLPEWDFFKVEELVCCMGEWRVPGLSFPAFTLEASLYPGCSKTYHPATILLMYLLKRTSTPAATNRSYRPSPRELPTN